MCLVVGVLGAVGSLGVGAANAVTASGEASTVEGIAKNTASQQSYYANQLQQLIANPSSVSSLPGYQFQLDQGSQAVARQMAGSGFLGSTNEADALDQYGQGLASSFYEQQANLLASLSGLTAASSPAQDTSAAASATSSASSISSGLLNSLLYMGMLGSGGGGLSSLFSGVGAGNGSDILIPNSGGQTTGGYTLNM